MYPYMQYPQPKRKPIGWVILLLTVCTFVAGSSFWYVVLPALSTAFHPVDGGYLAVSANGVAYLQITTATTNILGTSYNLQVSEQDAYANPVAVANGWSCPQSKSSTPTLGNIQGKQIILSQSPWFYNGNPSGLYDGNRITFTLPDASGALSPISFERASIEEYNTAMGNVKALCSSYGK